MKLDKQVINEAISDATSFLEVINSLIKIDIERYYIDLVAMTKTFYSQNDAVCMEEFTVTNMPPIAQEFNEKEIINLLRAIQAGTIDYPAFLRGIAKNGTVSYTVYIAGRQVTYTGRKGEIYIEKFPANWQPT